MCKVRIEVESGKLMVAPMVYIHLKKGEFKRSKHFKCEQKTIKVTFWLTRSCASQAATRSLCRTKASMSASSASVQEVSRSYKCIDA
jgi:hypothetical protein